MYNSKMTLTDVYAWLIDYEEEREREIRRFSDAVNKYLYQPHDPTPEDMFKLGCFFSNAGGATDEVSKSLIRLAALAGHKEAIEWYECVTEEKVA